VQAEELAVDRAATADALGTWERLYPKRLDEEVLVLRHGVTAVLGDVPALAFEAAALAGVPSFALANFSWDWIYEQMGFGDAAAAAAHAYESADLLFELTPAAPMNAFRSRIGVGVLGRSAAHERRRARETLGIAAHERFVLVALRSAASYALPAPSHAIRYATCDGRVFDRSDVVVAAGELSFLQLLAAADAVVAKAGYGIIADVATSGTRLLYTTRSGFPEDDVLARWLGPQPWARQVCRAHLAGGAWSDAVEQLLRIEAPAPLSNSGIVPALDAVRKALSG